MNRIQQIGGTLALSAAAFWAAAESARYTGDFLKQEVNKIADEAANIAVNAGAKITSELIGKTVIETGSKYYERRLMQELLPPKEFEKLKKKLEQALKQKLEPKPEPKLELKPEKSPSRPRIKQPTYTIA